ncbi:MAG: hypothetical protein R3B48_01630 [Kofleriaceae bacterium]
MARPPARPPTHLAVDPLRLASLGLEAEELAEDGVLAWAALDELAEDRGKPVSHYLAALALSDDVTLERPAGPVVHVCAGACQQWGALDLLEHLATRCVRGATFAVVPRSCLDRCDRAAVCVVESAEGAVVVEEATPAKLDEVLVALAPARG